MCKYFYEINRICTVLTKAFQKPHNCVQVDAEEQPTNVEQCKICEIMNKPLSDEEKENEVLCLFKDTTTQAPTAEPMTIRRPHNPLEEVMLTIATNLKMPLNDAIYTNQDLYYAAASTVQLIMQRLSPVLNQGYPHVQR